MQCNAIESVTCDGALCFAAGNETFDEGDGEMLGARTFTYDDNEEQTRCGQMIFSGDYETFDDGDETDVAENMLGARTVTYNDTFYEDEEKSNHSFEGGAATETAAENFDDETATGKGDVYDNDGDNGDEGTVDTALDITQDVTASEEDDDESADVEPADVKIDLDGDDDNDAAILHLDGEFAAKKDKELAVVTDNDESEEEKVDDEKSPDTNKTDDYSEENDRHTFIQVAQKEILTPQQQQQWNDKYASLLKYYNKNGTSTIPFKVNTKPKHLLLRRWADKQRLNFLNDGLDPNQIQKLVAIEFDFGQDIEELVAEKIEQERIEAEQKKAEALRLEEEAKAAAVRAEEMHLDKLRKRMNHKKKVEQMRSEAISVVAGN